MFESLESLCAEFGLARNLSKAKLRNEIKRRMASIHADKSGGDFPSEAIKQLYLRMQEALGYLDAPAKTVALQKKSNQETSALELRVAALEVAALSKGILLEETAQRASRVAVRRFRTGWISSAAFAAISSAILLYSQELSKNPVLSPFVTIFWVRLTFAAALTISGLGFIAMRSWELLLKRKVLALLSDDGIAWVVRGCVFNYKDKDDPNCDITQRKMMDVISKCGSRYYKSKLVRWLKGWLYTKVPRDVAEMVAKSQISILLERGVVKHEGIRGVEPLFVINSSLAKEIIDDYGAMVFDQDLF